jgi:hypothetical protein
LLRDILPSISSRSERFQALALQKAPFTETPQGAAHIETSTIMYGKCGPEIGIVIGRKDATGRRFLSNVPGNPAALMDLQERESLNRGLASTFLIVPASSMPMAGVTLKLFKTCYGIIE